MSLTLQKLEAVIEGAQECDTQNTTHMGHSMSLVPGP